MQTNNTGITTSIKVWAVDKKYLKVLVCCCQVKEKETARKEYRKAVDAGHGAYLMDQEKAVSSHIFIPVSFYSVVSPY